MSRGVSMARCREERIWDGTFTAQGGRIRRISNFVASFVDEVDDKVDDEDCLARGATAAR
jgi:hypothetical protein